MKNIVTIIIWIVFGGGCLLIWGCGARKVTIHKSKEETKTETVDNSVIEKQVDTNVKKTFETKVDDKNETLTKKTTYEPQDVTKEASITESDGKKTVLNNTKKIVEETVKKNNTKTETLKTIDSVKTAIEKVKNDIQKKHSYEKETKTKDLDKKQFNPINYYIGFAIFIIILVIAYFVLKRLKVI